PRLRGPTLRMSSHPARYSPRARGVRRRPLQHLLPVRRLVSPAPGRLVGDELNSQTGRRMASPTKARRAVFVVHLLVGLWLFGNGVAHNIAVWVKWRSGELPPGANLWALLAIGTALALAAAFMVRTALPLRD